MFVAKIEVTSILAFSWVLVFPLGTRHGTSRRFRWHGGNGFDWS